MSKLWSIYIPGMDEYHPAPNKQIAQHMAERHNAAMAAYRAKHPDPHGFGPTVKATTAVVRKWPFEPRDHAEEIAQFDYAGWGLAGEKA